VAAVLEDAPAHRPHRARARLYRTTAELLDILEELFQDRAQVEALARAGREWMERERNAAALGAERDSAYRALLAQSPNGRPAPLAETAIAGAEELTERLYLATHEEPGPALEACRELLARHPRYD